MLRARVAWCSRSQSFPQVDLARTSLTVRAFTACPTTRRELDETVEDSLRRASLFNEVKDQLDKPGTGLSGGQQQRLCIARAIAVSPEVIHG